MDFVYPLTILEFKLEWPVGRLTPERVYPLTILEFKRRRRISILNFLNSLSFNYIRI